MLVIVSASISLYANSRNLSTPGEYCVLSLGNRNGYLVDSKTIAHCIKITNITAVVTMNELQKLSLLISCLWYKSYHHTIEIHNYIVF